MAEVFVVVTLVVAVVTALYLRQLTAATDALAVKWALNRGLALSAAGTPIVSAYVRQSQALRALGIAAGIALPGAVYVAFGVESPKSSPVWPFVGYAVGALYAGAVTLSAPSGQRRASLSPRRLGDYMSRRLLTLQRSLAVVVVLLAGAAVLIPYREPRDRDEGFIVIAVLGAIAAAVIGELLQKRAVARAQPFDDAELVATDDAIRSHLVQTVAGAAIGIEVLAASMICGVLAMSDVQVLRWTMWIPAMFGWVAAIFACVTVVDRPWRVSRSSLASR